VGGGAGAEPGATRFLVPRWPTEYDRAGKDLPGRARDRTMFIDSFLGGQVTRAVVGISFDVADVARLDNAAALEAFVVRFEARVAEAKALHESVSVVARRLQDGSEVVAADHRATTIDRMLSAETAYEEGREMLVARSRASEADARHQPHLLPLLQRTTALIDEELRLRAEAARNLRWALLELEAAAEPAADGPVLATPAEVGSFLQGLRAAP